jgi:hypothetical protein
VTSNLPAVFREKLLVRLIAAVSFRIHTRRGCAVAGCQAQRSPRKLLLLCDLHHAAVFGRERDALWVMIKYGGFSAAEIQQYLWRLLADVQQRAAAARRN